MKKLIILFVSAVLMLSLFAGCGSPTDVFYKSDKAKDSTAMEKGKEYEFESLTFTLGDIKESKSNPDKKGDPQGKWVVVELKLTDGDVNNDALDKLIEDEVILLNGAAPSAQSLHVNISSFGGNSTSKFKDPSIQVYYDVPGRFDVEQATVSYTDDVKEK